MNALAREVAHNSARALLLQYVEQSLSRGESADKEDDGYAPKGAHDPAAVQFVARFKANVIALIEEASSAPAAFSIRHSLLPHDMEERLR